MHGKKIPQCVLNVYGLAVAVFIDLVITELRLEAIRMPPSSTTTLSPWKMRKEDLILALEELDVPYRREWSVPELRTTLIEEREKRGMTKPKQLTGLSHMSAAALREKCMEE